MSDAYVDDEVLNQTVTKEDEGIEENIAWLITYKPNWKSRLHEQEQNKYVHTCLLPPKCSNDPHWCEQ